MLRKLAQTQDQNISRLLVAGRKTERSRELERHGSNGAEGTSAETDRVRRRNDKHGGSGETDRAEKGSGEPSAQPAAGVGQSIGR